jgi:hypothetical protein
MTNKKTSPVVGTSRGKPITDADIERMADEAEAGYDITTLRPRGGRPPMAPAGPKWSPYASTRNCAPPSKPAPPPTTPPPPARSSAKHSAASSTSPDAPQRGR